MDVLLRYWLKWPSIEAFMLLPWAWPLCETLHFIGLSLLVGIVGMFDLRVLGYAKGLPPVALKRLIPWGVFGFVLCLVSGGLFVLGIGANLAGDNAYDVVARNVYLQLKFVFILLAGLNLTAFYLSGAADLVDELDAHGTAPLKARVIAGLPCSSGSASSCSAA